MQINIFAVLQLFPVAELKIPGIQIIIVKSSLAEEETFIQTKHDTVDTNQWVIPDLVVSAVLVSVYNYSAS